MRTGSGVDWADGKDSEVDDLLNRVGCNIIIFSVFVCCLPQDRPHNQGD